MNCPKCGGKTQIPGTRSDGEKVYRKRKCIECGHVFYTEEQLTANSYGYKFVYNEYMRGKHAEYRKN